MWSSPTRLRDRAGFAPYYALNLAATDSRAGTGCPLIRFSGVDDVECECGSAGAGHGSGAADRQLPAGVAGGLVDRPPVRLQSRASAVPPAADGAAGGAAGVCRPLFRAVPGVSLEHAGRAGWWLSGPARAAGQPGSGHLAGLAGCPSASAAGSGAAGRCAGVERRASAPPGPGTLEPVAVSDAG